MDLDITKNWLENQTLSLEVGTEFNKLIAEVEQLETQLEWIVVKVKTLNDYHTPTDNRDRDGEIKGWMHVLCASHESLHRCLKEFKETKTEVERLKAENEQLKTNQELWGSIELITAQRKEKEQLREALEKARTYLEERGIRHRGKVGRTEILPMIDEALKDSS